MQQSVMQQPVGLSCRQGRGEPHQTYHKSTSRRGRVFCSLPSKISRHGLLSGFQHDQRLKFCTPRDQGVRQRCKASGIPRAVALNEARELIARGQQKFNSGDRMGALKFFEESLEKAPTREERQAALFNATAVHASFGDVELAQITLREGINCGLSFDAAMRDEGNPLLVKMQVSPQVSILLRKFAEACKRVRAAVQTPPSPSPSLPASARALASRTGLPDARSYLGADVSDRLQTDVTGIDASVGGIIRRVVGLLVIGVVFGSLLFYVGLKYAFPEM